MNSKNTILSSLSSIFRPTESKRDNPVPKPSKKKKKKVSRKTASPKTASPDHFDTHVEDRNWDDSDMSVDMKCDGEAVKYAKVEDNKDIHHDYHIDGIAPRVGTALKILAAEHDPDDSDVSALAEGILRTGDHHILPLLADALDQSNHPMLHEFNWRQIPKAIKRDRRVKALLDNTIIPHILTDGTNKQDRNSLNPEKLINQWHLGRGKISKSKVLKVLKDVDKNSNIHDVVHSIIRLADNAKRLEYGADLPSQSPGWYREWIKKNAKMLSGREDIPFMYPNTKSVRKTKMSKKPVKFSHQYPSVQHMPFHPIFKPSGRLGKRSYDWFRKTLFHLYNALPENHPIKESAALAAKTGAHPYFEEIQDWASGIEEGSKEHQALLGSDGGPKRGDYFDDYVNFSGLQEIADSMMEHRLENNDPLMINKPSPSDRGNQREDEEPPASDYSTAFSKTKMNRRRYRFSREDIESILPSVQADPHDHASRGALADALEESGLHHDDESLDHLRSFDRPVYGMKHPESGKYVFSPRRRWLLGELVEHAPKGSSADFKIHYKEDFDELKNKLKGIGLDGHASFFDKSGSDFAIMVNKKKGRIASVIGDRIYSPEDSAFDHPGYPIIKTKTPQGGLLSLLWNRMDVNDEDPETQAYARKMADNFSDVSKRVSQEHQEMNEEDKLYSNIKKKEQLRRSHSPIKFSCLDRLRDAINNYHTVAKVMARKG